MSCVGLPRDPCPILERPHIFSPTRNLPGPPSSNSGSILFQFRWNKKIKVRHPIKPRERVPWGIFVRQENRGCRVETGLQGVMNPLVTSSTLVRPARYEKGLRHVSGGLFSCCVDEIPDYLIIAAPAPAITPSCCAEPPETPMAPMILPFSMMGTPPSMALMPSRVR